MIRAVLHGHLRVLIERKGPHGFPATLRVPGVAAMRAAVGGGIDGDLFGVPYGSPRR